MLKHNILLVDDDEENLFTTRSLLHRWGYNVDAAKSGDEAIDLVKLSAKDYAVVILDYKMPGKNGIEVANALRVINDEATILIYTAHPSLDVAKSAIRSGALDFIEKSEDLDYLRTTVEVACRKYEQVRKVKPAIPETEAEKLIASIGMVGRSVSLAEVARQVHKYRQSSKPVLILGETGVGKEIVAKAIHNGPKGTFFAVNCAAFDNSSLLESELFGYEKGAFTGAMNRKAGILEVASGGTVFLDELHHLPISAQAKLLRALRESLIRRVGAQQETEVSFRLIAASRPDLQARVDDGRFLSDLYYRLKFLGVEIPPLRERPEDIAPLVAHFCQKHFQETGQKKTFLQRAIRCLEKHAWPGNVGELDGYISAILTNVDRPTIDSSNLDGNFSALAEDSVSEMTFAQLEARQNREKRQFLLKMIRSSESILHAAQRMGMRHTSLHTLLTRMKLRAEIKADPLRD